MKINIFENKKKNNQKYVHILCKRYLTDLHDIIFKSQSRLCVLYTGILYCNLKAQLWLAILVVQRYIPPYFVLFFTYVSTLITIPQRSHDDCKQNINMHSDGKNFFFNCLNGIHNKGQTSAIWVNLEIMRRHETKSTIQKKIFKKPPYNYILITFNYKFYKFKPSQKTIKEIIFTIGMHVNILFAIIVWSLGYCD
jgi:hypothetical protein